MTCTSLPAQKKRKYGNNFINEEIKQARKAAPPTNGASVSQIPTTEQVIEDSLAESEQAFKSPFVFEEPIRRVAVIGAGPSGLATAKALLDAGLEVCVFERMSDVGGVWLYSDKSAPNPRFPNESLSAPVARPPLRAEGEVAKTNLKITPALEEHILRTHSPPPCCYADLFNNTFLPMIAFEDFPFPKDFPWFVSHTEMAKHYKTYAKHFGIYDQIQFNTSVKHVYRNPENGRRWRIHLSKFEPENTESIVHTEWQDTFDAVAVATGAYHTPYIPDMKGLKEWNTKWPDRVLHSKQYRRPEDYRGKNVLIVGGSISAVDFSLDLNGVANKVYMSRRRPESAVGPALKMFRSLIPEAVIKKPNVESFADSDGQVNGIITFVDGTTVDDIDYIILCTGYTLDFEFLGDLRAAADLPEQAAKPTSTEPLIKLAGKKILGAYRDIFAINDPTLAFVAMSDFLRSIGFYYYQGQAVGRVWGGQALLPSQDLMNELNEKRLVPFPSNDLSPAGERLRIQSIITWLNRHAEFLESDPKKRPSPLKGTDSSLDALWEQLMASWSYRPSVEYKKKRLAQLALQASQ